jgi:PPIC-type PPIASE domain
VRNVPLLLLALALSDCARKPAASTLWIPGARSDLGEVVARVGQVPIFAAEVTAAAARSGKSERAALEDLLAFHLLAERARAAGPWPPRTPEAAALRKGILVQRLLEREFEPGTGPQNISDAELRVLYDRGKQAFVHARLVEVATLEVTPGAKVSADARAAARQTVLDLEQLAGKGHPLAAETWQSLAGQETWRGRGVHYRRFLQGPEGPYSARFAAAVAKLETAGATTGVIEDERGFYLARYLADRPASNVSFEQARAELRSGYYPRWRKQKFLDFAEHAAKRHEVELPSNDRAGASGS